MACRRKANHLLWGVLDSTTPTEKWKAGWGAEGNGAGVVPDHLAEPPKRAALVRFPSGAAGGPGARITTDYMMEKPDVYWDADPKAFYTLAVIDMGLNDNGR